jgi:hypothetical protein
LCCFVLFSGSSSCKEADVVGRNLQKELEIISEM